MCFMRIWFTFSDEKLMNNNPKTWSNIQKKVIIMSTLLTRPSFVFLSTSQVVSFWGMEDVKVQKHTVFTIFIKLVAQGYLQTKKIRKGKVEINMMALFSCLHTMLLANLCGCIVFQQGVRKFLFSLSKVQLGSA